MIGLQQQYVLCYPSAAICPQQPVRSNASAAHRIDRNPINAIRLCHPTATNPRLSVRRWQLQPGQSVIHLLPDTPVLLDI